MKTLEYDIPILVHDPSSHGSRLLGRLTASRLSDGEFWEGKVSVGSSFRLGLHESLTPSNGGFGHLTHSQFLTRVAFVFGFQSGTRFDFVSEDFEPSRIS